MAKSSSDRIEKKIELKAPVGRVWGALSDHEKFGEWFGVKLKGPFVVGKTTKGKITYPGYEHLTMEVLVEKLEKERLFAFRWHPYAVDPKVDYSKEPMTLVEFRMQKTQAGTMVNVSESGFDGIPAKRRDEAFRMNSGGWEQQMKNIEKHVGKGR